MAQSATVGLLKVLLTANSAEFETAMKKASGAAKLWSDDMKRVGRQATEVGTALTKTITLPLAGLAIASVKAAMDFESAFANVGKTVEGVSDKFGKLTPKGLALANAMRQMAKEMPQTVEELSNIAAMGGQMGVPIDNLEHFTKNVAALGVAVDGIGAEEAAMGLAQIANVFGDKEVKNIAGMSSALVHLGNSSNATEADILEFTKRLAGAGKSAKMSIPEIMGIGTAMANVGINAEAGGTAMSTMITKMSMAVSEGGAKLKAFDEVVAHTGKSFTQLWGESPAQAVNAVVAGLGKAQASGKDLNLVVKEIGATNIRTADTMKRLAGAGDGISTSIKIANEGMSAQNKHLEEAEKKYATTANQLKILWNTIKDVGITLGNALLPTINSLIGMLKTLTPILEAAAKAFAMAPGPVQAIIVGLGLLLAAAGPVIWAFGQLTLSASAVIGAFGKNGIATRALTVMQGELALSSSRTAVALGLLGKAAAVAGAAFVGWQIGRLIADLAGLDQKIADSLTHLDALNKARGSQASGGEAGRQGVTDQLVQKERELSAAVRDGNKALAARLQGEIEAIKTDTTRLAILDTINKAIANGADKNITYAAAVKFNAEKQREVVEAGTKHAETTEKVAQTTERATKATDTSSKAIKAAEKAQAEAQKAAEAHNKVIQEQADALQKLGVVTENQVLKSLGEFTTLVEHATAAGVPLDKVLLALAPHLAALKAQAVASGVALGGFSGLMDQATNASKRMLDQLARTGTPAVVDGLKSLPGTVIDLNDAMNAGAIQAQNTADSFKFFGLSTRSELIATAQAAVAHYNTIRASGTATPEAIKKAFEAMNAALVAAGLKTADTLSAQFKGLAMQLGRDLIGAVANGISTGDWSQIGESVKQFLGSAIETGLNKLIPGLGSLMRPLTDAIIDKIDSALDFNEGRDLVTDFADSVGGFDALHRELNKLGAEGERLWIALTQGVGRDNPEQAIAAIKAVQDALGNIPRTMAELASDAGFKTIDELKFVAAEAVKLAQYMEASGLFSAEAVAEAWEQAHEALVKAGDQNAIAADKAKKAISELQAELDGLNKSVANEAWEENMGVEETLARERIAQIEVEIEAKKAAIEAEAKAREEADRQAAESAKTGAAQVRAEGEATYDYLSDLFGKGFRVPIRWDIPTLPSFGSPSGYASTGAIVSQSGLQHLSGGGTAMPQSWRRGTDTVLAGLTPGEVVLNEGQQGNLAEGMREAMQFVHNLKVDLADRVPGLDRASIAASTQMATLILNVDGRTFGRGVAPILPGEVRRLGVKVRN